MKSCIFEAFKIRLCLYGVRLDESRRAAADAREKLERQNQQLSDMEAEVGLLRRRVEQLETDRDKDKKLIAQLQESLNRARAVRSLDVSSLSLSSVVCL